MFNKVLMLFVLWLLLSSCAHKPTVSAVNPLDLYGEPKAEFGPEIPLPDVSDLFELTAEQTESLLAFYRKQKFAGETTDRIIYNYLLNEAHNFTYRARTFPATETLTNLEGNCLSLAILTAAIGQITNVHVRFELVDSAPIFERQNNIIERGVHVRTKVFRPLDEVSTAIFNNSPGIIIDYFPTGGSRFVDNITEKEFFAMYYNNIAVELLEEKKITQAYWYSRKALQLAPEYAPHINTMAIIHRRMGDFDRAERIYRYALTIPTDHLVILKNYRVLLLLQSRLQEVAQIDKKIAELYDPNPYAWVDLGDEAYNLGRYKEAQEYYERVIEMAPYLQQGYFGMAKVWYQRGNYKKTRSMLLSAMENNSDADSELRYQAKLKRLSEEERADI